MEDKPLYYLPHDRLSDLLSSLHSSGYICIGPQARDGAIVYEQLEHADQLPWYIKTHQAPGEYRLEKTAERQVFAFVHGPQAIKPLLFKSSEPLWKAKRNDAGKLVFSSAEQENLPIAVIGARACDLAAMAIQDKIFLEGEYVDPRYKAYREKLFIVAANCTRSCANCFCDSMGTGPKATKHFDIALTELEEGFVVEIEGAKAQQILDLLQLPQATDAQKSEGALGIVEAAKTQTKKMSCGKEMRDILFVNLNHPQWDDVAKRCLSCGNCTMVCPTCFCHKEFDRPSLDGSSSQHQREWDSCFTRGHSYIHGNLIREDTKKRYRQWLTHKFGSWYDQFGTSGCVGCGRCITWCPVGIDITEEAKAICL